MICTNCGKKTRLNGSTCTNCGFDLKHVIALMNEPDDASDDFVGEMKTAEEIVRRALILAGVIACAYGDPKPEVIKWLKKEKLWKETTPIERAFLLKETSPETNIAFTWKIEALVPLLWAIKKIKKMPGISKQCDNTLITKAVIWWPSPTREYVSSSMLRDEQEIREEYEKIYRAHWKLRDTQDRGKPIPKNLDAEVVQERHHGFNWVIGYMGQPWDDITTDT